MVVSASISGVLVFQTVSGLLALLTVCGGLCLHQPSLLLLYQTLEVPDKLVLLHQVYLLCLTQNPHLLSLRHLLFFQFLFVFFVLL